MAHHTGSTGRWCFHPLNPHELFSRLWQAVRGRCLRDEKPVDQSTAEFATGLPLPDTNQDWRVFRDEYLLKEVLRKCPDWNLGIDTEKAALDAWMADERLNTLTNARLYHVDPDNLGYRVLLDKAAVKIGKVLGRFNTEEFLAGWRFGPGSTVSLSLKNAKKHIKLSTKPECTRSIAAAVAYAISGVPQWQYDGDSSPNLCEYDVWMCVPKNAKTGRSIGVPPGGNVVFQLSLGKMMRRRLFRAGINLQDQSINQALARQASVDKRSATVDVRAASQSNTSALVFMLFRRIPDWQLDGRWFSAMELCRTRFTLLPDGTLHENQYFSSMGNGFTFELESLIFWALSQVCCEALGLEPSVSVYGDDIIVPTAVVPLLEDVFAYAGFQLNMSKSFSGDCNFRESCGGHYLEGRDVTPFYVDASLTDVSTVVLLANNILRWSLLPGGGRDGRMRSVWMWVVAHLPYQLVENGIPLGEQDDGLILDWDEVVPSAAWIDDGIPAVVIRNGEPVHFYKPTRKTKLVKTRTFIGWRVQTAVQDSRPVGFEDAMRLKTWLYDGSPDQGKFHSPVSAPAVDLNRRDDGYRFWHEYVRSAKDIESWIGAANTITKLKGEVESMLLSTRVVLQWTRLGAWTSGSMSNSFDWRQEVAMLRSIIRSQTPPRFIEITRR